MDVKTTPQLFAKINNSTTHCTCIHTRSQLLPTVSHSSDVHPPINNHSVLQTYTRTGTHLPCGYMEQLRVCLEVLCNSQEWHPSPLVSLKELSSCGHTPSVPDPRVTLGPWLAQVHTYPVGTWNSSDSASKCFETHKNGTHLHWSAWKYLLVVVTPPVFRIRA